MKPLSKLVCIHLIYTDTYTQICANPRKYFSITIDPVDKVAAELARVHAKQKTVGAILLIQRKARSMALKEHQTNRNDKIIENEGGKT